VKRALVIIAALPLFGCIEPDMSSSNFITEATRTESCGDAGLLASAPAMELNVNLRFVSEHVVQWDDGSGMLVGDFAPVEHAFQILEQRQVDMRTDDALYGPDGTPLPDCSILRQRQITAVLDGTAPEDYAGFSGQLIYAYGPTEGSSCGDLLQGAAPIANALPCTVAYDLAATRQE